MKNNPERLYPSAANMLERSNKDRIDFIDKETWIAYPYAKTVLEKMERLFNEPPKTRKEGMLLYGPSTNGKTTILKQFIRLHKPGEYQDGEGNMIEMHPVLYIMAPPTPDESRLYANILSGLHVPYRERDPITTKQSLVEHYLKLMNTHLLIIDEIHNVLSGTYAKRRIFMNALKNLSNTLSLSIVLSGTYEAMSAISVDDQIRSRFRPMELPIWENDQHFAIMMATLEKMLPLRKSSDLYTNKKLLAQIHHKCSGSIGEAINLVKFAAIKAIESGSESIGPKELFEENG